MAVRCWGSRDLGRLKPNHLLSDVNRSGLALSPGSVDCFPAARFSPIRGIQGWHHQHHCSPSAKELRKLIAWLPQQLLTTREIDHITATPDLLMDGCVGGMQAKDLIEGEGLQNRGCRSRDHAPDETDRRRPTVRHGLPFFCSASEAPCLDRAEGWRARLCKRRRCRG